MNNVRPLKHPSPHPPQYISISNNTRLCICSLKNTHQSYFTQGWTNHKALFHRSPVQVSVSPARKGEMCGLVENVGNILQNNLLTIVITIKVDWMFQMFKNSTNERHLTFLQSDYLRRRWHVFDSFLCTNMEHIKNENILIKPNKQQNICTCKNQCTSINSAVSHGV